MKTISAEVNVSVIDKYCKDVGSWLENRIQEKIISHYVRHMFYDRAIGNDKMFVATYWEDIGWVHFDYYNYRLGLPKWYVNLVEKYFSDVKKGELNINKEIFYEKYNKH
jgi:hypothetical protein